LGKPKVATMQRGKRSGLQTRIAAMESVSSCVRMRNGLHFWNWKGPFVSTYGANNANHNRRDGGKRFVVHADEKLAAFLELKSVIRASGDCA